jgi:hypothetical protein
MPTGNPNPDHKSILTNKPNPTPNHLQIGNQNMQQSKHRKTRQSANLEIENPTPTQQFAN